jgi:hypothetical protein
METVAFGKEYTNVQCARKMRAKNKGLNKRLAATLRDSIAWLENKGPEDFSRAEIEDLQRLAGKVAERLHKNALTKAFSDLIANPERYQVDGGYLLPYMDPKDFIDIRCPVAAKPTTKKRSRKRRGWRILLTPGQAVKGKEKN